MMKYRRELIGLRPTSGTNKKFHKRNGVRQPKNSKGSWKMKSKYKLLGFVGVSLLLVALLLVAMIPVGGQDFPVKKIERNLRHPQGEIIELAGPLSLEECERFHEYVQEHKDAFWFVDNTQLLVGLFVQEFVYASDLIDDILYRDIHQDGTARIGVTSRDVIEEFKELGIPITFEIIDLDEVRHLEEAAREIAEKPYEMGVRYDYSAGRIRVTLTKQNWDLYKTIYREYSDFPLLFRFVDPKPETDHGGGEEIEVCQVSLFGLCMAWGSGTSGFLADWYGQDVMVTAGHMGPENKPVRNENDEIIGTTEEMVDEGRGEDAGFYTAESGVTFNNIIAGGPLEIDGWAEDDPNVDDWIFYYSAFRYSVWCRVTDVEDYYFEYWRDDGGLGDSGSPVFTVTEGLLIHGVHTHELGQGYGSTGYATNIDQVQDLLGVMPPFPREDFEWGDDGDDLDESGGDVEWTVIPQGNSEAKIDNAHYYRGTKSGKWHADQGDPVRAYFTCSPVQSYGFHFYRDSDGLTSHSHGYQEYRIHLKIARNGAIKYYNGTQWIDTEGSVSNEDWYRIYIQDINWTNHTFDIYLDGIRIKDQADMEERGISNNIMSFRNNGANNFWLDDINVVE